MFANCASVRNFCSCWTGPSFWTLYHLDAQKIMRQPSSSVNGPHLRVTTSTTYKDAIPLVFAILLAGNLQLLEIDIFCSTMRVLNQFPQAYTMSERTCHCMALVRTSGVVVSLATSCWPEPDRHQEMQLQAIVICDSSLGWMSAMISAYSPFHFRSCDALVTVQFPNEHNLTDSENTFCWFNL